jgi:hypothetical protein
MQGNDDGEDVGVGQGGPGEERVDLHHVGLDQCNPFDRQRIDDHELQVVEPRIRCHSLVRLQNLFQHEIAAVGGGDP